MNTEVATDPLLGRVIDGRFRIDERIGAGGMGVVYRARQLNVDRDVALKLLKPERVKDEAAAAAFLREAKTISALRSPHTVTLIDMGSFDDRGLFIAMELLEGQTLRQRLAAQALSVDETVRVLDQVALSLAEAHASGIVHRDLKPLNVMLVRTHGRPVAKVLDFGLAVLAGSDDAPLAGTPQYLAPELVSGEKPTARADVYALGVMMFEMLVGRAPFAADSTEALLRAHLEQEPPSLASAAPDLDVPEAVHQLLARCLAKPKALRPKDAAAFRNDLRDAFGAEPDDEPRADDSGGDAAGSDTQATLLSVISLSHLDQPAPRSRLPRRWWLAPALAATALLAWRITHIQSPPRRSVGGFGSDRNRGAPDHRDGQLASERTRDGERVGAQHPRSGRGDDRRRDPR